MSMQIEEAIKSERLQRLQQAIDESQAKFNRNCLHRTLDVLFERRGRHAGQLVGRSPYLQPVQATAPDSLIGEIAAVTITEIGSNSLFGALAAVEPRAAATQPAATVLDATGARICARRGRQTRYSSRQTIL